MDLPTIISLDREFNLDLDRWASNVEAVNGSPLSTLEPDLVIFSDAFLSGWGAASNDASAKGPWTGQDRSCHINELEILAALFALKSFTSQASRVSVRLMLDNHSLLCEQIRRFKVGSAVSDQ